MIKVDWKGLFQGIWNSVFVKAEIEKVSTTRLEICRGCTFNSTWQKEHNGYKTLRPDFHCTQCGCDLLFKTRSLSQNCPLTPPKWAAVMTQEEEYEIDQKLQQDHNAKSSS